MTAQPEKNILLNNVNEDLPKEKKIIPTRPNIDHLIKRIITERRQESRKNLLTFIVVLLVIGGLFIFFY